MIFQRLFEKNPPVKNLPECELVCNGEPGKAYSIIFLNKKKRLKGAFSRRKFNCEIITF
jgi:hypothetical protein